MHSEEHATYWMLAGFGALGAASELLTRQTIGTRATVALLMFAFGVIGLVRTWLAPAPLPTARIQR